MTNAKRLEQKIENEKLVFALDQYADYGLLQIYTDIDFINLRKELLIKYDLKDVGVANYFISENDFHKLPDNIEIIENDLKFIVKLKENLNSFPIEKKLAREVIQSHSSKKDVLDLFANTGTFSIYASTNAKSVTSVESRKFEVLNFEQNISENEIYQSRPTSKPQIWKQNYKEFIKIAIETKTKYDLIILDLSKYTLKNLNVTLSPDEGFNLQNEHLDFIKMVQDKLLNPAGFIFFITDEDNFVLDKYIRPGADKLTKQTIGEEYGTLKIHQSFVFYN